MQWRTVNKGGDPITLGPRAGIPKRLRPSLPEEVLSNQRGLRPRTPKGRLPEDLRQRVRDSVATDPPDTTVRRRTILPDTIRVDGRTRQHSRRTTGTDYWDIHSYIFPFVSSASFSLLALFQTLRRHWCRLLRQRLNFSSPSRVVVSSDVVGSGKHWSRSDCRANNPVAGKARNRSYLPIGHGVTVPDPDSCRVAENCGGFAVAAVL